VVDTSVKYQVKRVDTSLSAKGKGRSVIIRTNLKYDAAMGLIKGFNDKEGTSQTIREEEAGKKYDL
jgi:hypothetical protein